MDDIKLDNKRPVAITVICIIGFIGVFAALPLIFSEVAKSIGDWYPPYLAFSTVAGLTCMIGMWMMKKWGIVAYTALTGLNQIVLLVMSVWNMYALIIPGIVIVIGFSQFEKMK